MFPRLSQLAKSFQRIRYHRLRFEVVAAWPSTAAGSYVAGFVKDATDPVRPSSATSTLLASGGTAVKIWQSTEVVITSLPGLFYTSTAANSERWSSPGSFVASLLSRTAVPGSMQVYVHWDVTLSQPTYEAEGEGGDDGFVSVDVDVYSSNNNTYLSKRSGNDWTPLLLTDFSPPLLAGDRVRFLAMKFPIVENSSGTIDGAFGFHTVEAMGAFVYPVDEKFSRSTQNFHGETYVMFKGEKGERTRKSPNLMGASWYLSPAPALQPSTITRLLCHLEAPQLRQGKLFDCSNSFYQGSLEKEDPEPSIPTSMASTSSLQPLLSTSGTTPPSNVEKLFSSLERRMERLLSLQENSTDFELV